MSEGLLYDTALKKAMSLCAAREICRSEIRTRLLSWGMEEKEAETAISMLVKDRFIDEARYASAFVSDKFRYNKWGKVKIAAALSMKSIPEHVINTALSSIADDLYLATLKELLSLRRRKIKAKNQFDLKGKLLRFGLSRGFESRLLYDILNRTD